MNKLNIFMIIALTSLVAACGGGSEGTNQAPAPAPVQTTPPPNPAPQILGVMDLNIAPGFELETHRELTLEVDVSARYQGNVYLNLCEGIQNKPNYAKCLLRTPLSDGQLITSLSVANDTSSLVAELIDLADPTQSDYTVWSAQTLSSISTLTVN